MIHPKVFWRFMLAAALVSPTLCAHAQADYSAYGALYFSYGRF